MQAKLFPMISYPLVFIALVWSIYTVVFQGNYHLLWWSFFAWALVSSIEQLYYHRYLAHNSWKCPRWMDYIFLLIGTGFDLLPAIYWAGGHRKHHHLVDHNKVDMQGPTVPFSEDLKTILGGLVIEPKWMGSLWKDKLLVNQAIYYWPIMLLFALVWTLLFGIESYLIIHATHKIINLVFNRYIFHGASSKSNEAKDTFSLGEFRHKYHHDNPSSPTFGGYDYLYHGIIKWFPK